VLRIAVAVGRRIGLVGVGHTGLVEEEHRIGLDLVGTTWRVERWNFNSMKLYQQLIS
jgi:hypothetical protein